MQTSRYNCNFHFNWINIKWKQIEYPAIGCSINLYEKKYVVQFFMGQPNNVKKNRSSTKRANFVYWTLYCWYMVIWILYIFWSTKTVRCLNNCFKQIFIPFDSIVSRWSPQVLEVTISHRLLSRQTFLKSK